jgi:ABC-2 type transport system permease protein
VNGLLPNAWTIAVREYRQRVRNKAFVIVTAVLALIGIGIALLPIAGKLIAGDEVVKLAVYSTEDELETVTANGIDLILSANTDGGYQVLQVDDLAGAQAKLRDGAIDGLLSVSRREDDDELVFDLLTDARPTAQWLVPVRQAVTQVSIGDRLLRSGVDPEDAGAIFAPTPFEVTPLNPDAQGPEELGAAYMMAMLMVILTFMAVITYGQWVAISVAEEKSSRVMELLITAATPRQLLAGKVLGTSAAGLTQYGVVVASAFIGLQLQGVVAEQILGQGGSAGLENLNLWLFAPFAVFFLGGFLLYATLYAGLGSLASRQEDVQMVTGPMIVVGMVGYFAAFVGLNTPDAAWVQILSLIPFFSPYMLPIRVQLGSMAAWEWGVAAVLMVLFLAGALWVAARIYSAGVLLYGQRPGLRAMWRAVRVAR